jgi:hypothetical protein
MVTMRFVSVATHHRVLNLLVCVALGTVFAACDGTGEAGECPLQGRAAAVRVDFGSPFDQSFSSDRAYQAVLGIEGGRYAQLFVAPAGTDTTAVLLGYGAPRTTPLEPGTYEIRNSEKIEARDAFDGFQQLVRSEQLAGVGESVAGSVDVKHQCAGLASGSFAADVDVSHLTARSVRVDTVRVTGTFTVRSDSAAVQAFIPFDRAVEIDSTDV